MTTKRTTEKHPAKKAGAEPEGMPFSIVVGAADPTTWLKELAQRAELLRKMRPLMSENASLNLKQAVQIARMAAKAIEQGRAETAAWSGVKALHHAWLVEIEVGAYRKLLRDQKRQAGTKEKRGSRRPVLDAWIDAELNRNPDSDDKTLWRAVARPGADLEIFMDGDRVCDGGDSDRGLTFPGFSKRVTAARKRRK